MFEHLSAVLEVSAKLRCKAMDEIVSTSMRGVKGTELGLRAMAAPASSDWRRDCST